MKSGEKETRVAQYRPAAVLQVQGVDTLTFLQGQFTQNLKTGWEGARYGLWLNQKGKVLADSFVVMGSEAAATVVSVFSPAAVIRERLEAYIIADDVAVTDVTSDWTAFAVLGEGAGEILAPWRQSALIFRGRRWGGESWECIYPVGELAGLPAARVIADEDLERLRIEAGFPKIPEEVGPGDLPNEAGLEHDAISYTKGCYLGQEVMARLKMMGQVRRRLMRVRGRGLAVPARLPVSLVCGDKTVGELRTAIAAAEGFVGVAMVTITALSDPRGIRIAGNVDTILKFEELRP
jgi:tRNA-modifying protein YgfZ